MNPQTVIELATSENRSQLSRSTATASSPAMRTGRGTVRANVGAAMVRCGQRLAAGQTTDAAAPRRRAVNAALY